MKVASDALETLVRDLFSATGSNEAEAKTVAQHLVESNLAGHDSHGVIRASAYVEWLRDGRLKPNQQLSLVIDSGQLAVWDGNLGFGQVMGLEATHRAIVKADKFGLCAVGLRNASHLGRIGHYAELVAKRGLIGFFSVTTSGAGILVAPHGGIDRRLSANPLAFGFPRPGSRPIVLDISTCAIAEGKIKVAFNQGVSVFENCIIDAAGKPTTSPDVFYGDPPGSILPFGGHKGFGLGIMVELLAGALIGNGCSRTGVKRLEQGMFIIILDPKRFCGSGDLEKEVDRFFDFIKSSRPSQPGQEILLPGEPEELARRDRLQNGIELDDATIRQLRDACFASGLEQARVDSVLRPSGGVLRPPGGPVAGNSR